MILDEANDRLVLFGGSANDTWSLPLSGPNANVWSELSVEGEHPPAHSLLAPDSVVYDPVGRRMLVVIDSYSPSAGDVWQLSLGDVPKWTRLAAGPAPAFRWSSATLDAVGQRLFVIGSQENDEQLWSLGIGDGSTWTRWPYFPPGNGRFNPVSSPGACLVYDVARGRLIVIGIFDADGPGAIWALSTETQTWSMLAPPSREFDATVVYDPSNDRLVTLGGVFEPPMQIATLSLATGEWATSNAPGGTTYQTAVLDAKRGRILGYGAYELAVDNDSNALSALALDTLTSSEVAHGTGDAREFSESTLVWDPMRSSVVGYGGTTVIRRPNGSKGWKGIQVGANPSPRWPAVVYDTAHQAIISVLGQGGRLVRLLSRAGAQWEVLGSGPPTADRYWHAAVYDAAHDRVVVYGGSDGTQALGDVWAHPPDRSGAWVELHPSGPSPGARFGQVAIYDPEGRRMLVYGGSANYAYPNDTPYRDAWSLSLDDPPRWTELTVSGTPPGALGVGASAAYDEGHRRMIVVTFAPFGSYEQDAAAQVYALELSGDLPSWHRFCSPGITPGTTSANVVLTSDGLFLSQEGSAFRFGLETPYCDDGTLP